MTIVASGIADATAKPSRSLSKSSKANDSQISVGIGFIFNHQSPKYPSGMLGWGNMRFAFTLSLAAVGISFLLPSDGLKAALFIACAILAFVVMREQDEEKVEKEEGQQEEPHDHPEAHLANERGETGDDAGAYAYDYYGDRIQSR
ncbi:MULTISPECIES: hypothetical protein [unclassified Sinorhizobium]|uniref:hypothetical protein n=1 Tax=unclassified Sinorhizobium TaxID=2613772 RepID=UPI0024C450D3|nr:MULTISPECIES: hypothetical protein [unclassified Sinorhizobium]MDK1374546.1 hypothetical protein [Sinorhizobium sp. 6-70]MDK1478255.1 hypothetical protein [Sinorhizobium sp. 6-117]